MSKLASESWEALFRAQVAIMRRLEADDLGTNLTLKEYDVLYALRSAAGAENVGVRLKDLNEYVLLHQSALSRMVERLEARGLVVRSPATHDKRGTEISLTELGREVQAKMGRAHSRQIQHYVGNALTDEELVTLRAISQKLRMAQSTISSYPPPATEK